MKASQAAQLVIEARIAAASKERENNSQYMAIMKNIVDAAKNGTERITIHGILEPVTISLLKEDGYNVTGAMKARDAYRMGKTFVPYLISWL
jgi:hypothetical protein